MAENKDIDSITGVETTGHEWDGIKELNNPLPKWWLYVLYACIVWAFCYWIAMPAWPLVSSYTKGVLGYTNRTAVAASLERASANQAAYRDAIRTKPLDEILADPSLLEFALAGGRASFGDNCAPCHGSGAQGFTGYPNLNDDDWLWGGTLDDIHHTINYGIRTDHEDTRVNDMPAFGRDEILSREEIADVADYVLSLSGQTENPEAVERGAQIFEDNCVACHGEGGTGIQELGAPNLANGLWLYGGDRADVIDSISNSRRGVMPHWIDRLDENTIKQLVIYVHSLGGGQ
ncbi:MAG: cytochrome-c oxidase, cbb3-type subunit III [Pseudomonadota bacterium]